MSEQSLAEKQNTQISHASAVTPMQMLARAVEQNADMDKLEKLMALQERWEANEARKAWNQAMNALKADPPHVQKNKKVQYNSTSYSHASLDNMANSVSQAMTPHGLSFRWETNQANNQITVTCIVSHRDGHSERTTLSAGADQSGGKNSIQAVGSAVTYLQRYTLKSAVGIAEEGQDDDAIGAEEKEIQNSPERVALVKRLSDAANEGHDTFMSEWKTLNRDDRYLVGNDEYMALKSASQNGAS